MNETTSAPQTCLHCGETPASIKRDKIIACCTVSGYETPEVDEEWPHHRWADWNDQELADRGVLPAAYERHRRTPETTFQWIACLDTTRGHTPATPKFAADFGYTVGQCISCGHTPPTTNQEPTP